MNQKSPLSASADSVTRRQFIGLICLDPYSIVFSARKYLPCPGSSLYAPSFLPASPRDIQVGFAWPAGGFKPKLSQPLLPFVKANGLGQGFQQPQCVAPGPNIAERIR
jgi:hypothetical protein